MGVRSPDCRRVGRRMEARDDVAGVADKDCVSIVVSIRFVVSVEARRELAERDFCVEERCLLVV